MKKTHNNKKLHLSARFYLVCLLLFNTYFLCTCGLDKYDYIENPEYATKFESDVLLKVKNDCSLLDGGKYNESMFDKAFSFAFEKLNIIFKEFKFSREFSILQAKIGIESYVRCKMYNTGLINKN